MVGPAAGREDPALRATVRVREDGETRTGASGPCPLSQRPGDIDIDRRNGNTIGRSPGEEENRFKGRKGKGVVRTVHADGSHEYERGGRKLIKVRSIVNAPEGAASDEALTPLAGPGPPRRDPGPAALPFPPATLLLPHLGREDQTMAVDERALVEDRLGGDRPDHSAARRSSPRATRSHREAALDDRSGETGSSRSCCAAAVPVVGRRSDPSSTLCRVRGGPL